MSRVIIHIDLNAFFASAMQIKYPHLKDKPVAVCSDTRGSVVTTASYEARAFGVRSAMPLVVAKRLCPDLEVVETDFKWFSELSQKFISLLKTYTPRVEQASIDECYVDVSEVIKTYKKPLNLVVEIQKSVKEKLGLSCSIGLAPNKFLAKMASDMKKPNGITILRKREVSTKLWPLPVGEMLYVGKKTEIKLKKAGIKTIGDLANADELWLSKIVGNQATSFRERAWGHDNEEIVMNHDVKSISASQSLFESILDYDEISQLISSLCRDIASKTQKERVKGKTLTLHVRFDHGAALTKSLRKEHGYAKYEDLYQVAMLLFDELDQQEPIKFCSVSLMNLVETEIDEIYNLFNMNHVVEVDDIIKTTNKLIGKDVLKRANELEEK